MLLEGQRPDTKTGNAQRARLGRQPCQHALVAAMHAVEIADGQGQGTAGNGQAVGQAHHSSIIQAKKTQNHEL